MMKTTPNLSIENIESFESKYAYCKEEIESTLSKIHLSTPNSPEFNQLKQHEQFLINLLREFEQVNQEFNEYAKEPQDKYDYLETSIRILTEENRHFSKEIVKAQKEEFELKNNIKQYEILKENEMILTEETSNQLNYIKNLEEANNEYNLLKKIYTNINIIINNIMKTSKEENNLIDAILLKKYITLEIVNGIKITDNSNENSDSWYNLMFLNLPDECLDFEKNLNLSQLTPSMVEKYKSLFEKRKSKQISTDNTKKVENCVIVNNLNDYKIISKNYISLMCSILTKQEIVIAMKKFTIAWVDGSQVLTYNIDAQVSKQATIILPLYYPLSGTSSIKLASLNGYEECEDDSKIKNFSIKDNLNSLSEWISVLTEMFHSKTIF